jgi:hypothetical protein
VNADRYALGGESRIPTMDGITNRTTAATTHAATT